VSKWWRFSFIFSHGNRRGTRGQVSGTGWVGDNRHIVFGQKFPTEKRNDRGCIVVLQQPLLLLPQLSSSSSSSFYFNSTGPTGLKPLEIEHVINI
jgi:hypothetical protein